MSRQSRCRACDSARLEAFHEVPSVPVNSCILIEDRQAALAFPTGELVLAFCADCGFIFNAAFDPSRIEYSAAYEETQGFSARFREFAADLARTLVERHDLQDREILEIGCGKGEFLAQLCEIGPNRGIGIDPSFHPGRLESPALDRMRFIRDFYGPSYASELAGDLVCCRHTLEHISPVAEFARLARTSAAQRPGSVVFFEVPDTVRVLREGAFWDIYYEHCSYFTAGSLARLFARVGLPPERVELVFDDQYLLLTAAVGAPGSTELGEPVRELRAEVDRFAETHRRTVAHWRETLGRLRGRRPVVWGAGSKAVAWLTTLGLSDEVELLVDINPNKQGRFLAGTGHEVVAPEALVDYRPEAVIVMNPIYRAEIARDLARLGVEAELLAV